MSPRVEKYYRGTDIPSVSSGKACGGHIRVVDAAQFKIGPPFDELSPMSWAGINSQLFQQVKSNYRCLTTV